VKVSNLKRTPLEEGFIDNLVGKAMGMSGGDGITGFIRSLRGEGAALRKLADAIEVGLVSELRRLKGQEFAKVQKDQVELPLTEMIKLALKSAEAVSSKETGTAASKTGGVGGGSSDPVSAAQIAEFIKNNKRAVVTVAGGGVNAIVDAIVQVAGGAKATAIANLKYEKALDGICLCLAAATIIATGEDLSEAPFKMDDKLKQKFEEFGTRILDILLDPSNGLKQNQDFIDNIKNLFFVHYLNERVRKRYAVMTATQLVDVIRQKPDIITDGEYKRFLSQHNPTVAAAAGAVFPEVKTAMQGQFEIWLQLAAAEAATGRKPQQSLGLYNAWGMTALQMLDQSKFGSAAGAAAAPGEPEASPLDNPEKFIADLEKYIAGGGKISPELLALLKELVK